MLPFFSMAQIYCDFDGTITSQDSIIFLTEHFGAGPEYRDSVREAIQKGKIGVYEAIREELATVRIPWEKAVTALKSNIVVDPTFPDFVKWCKEKGHSLTVASAGMKPVIDLFIGDLGLPVYAQSLVVTTEGWDYRKNESRDKQQLFAAAKRNGLLVHIGDGTSDVAAIPFADFLFARVGSYLANHCQENQVPYIPFENFNDIQEALAREDLGT